MLFLCVIYYFIFKAIRAEASLIPGIMNNLKSLAVNDLSNSLKLNHKSASTDLFAKCNGYSAPHHDSIYCLLTKFVYNSLKIL